MEALAFIAEELEGLRRRGLLRSPEGPRRLAPDIVDLTSNDYLGLGRSIVSRETLFSLPPLPAGSGSSRLLDGTHSAHEALEAALAAWVGQPSALLFASGYAANVGLLQALAGPGDLLVSDALNHASIVDGCRLSRAEVVVTPHLDLQAVDDALGRAARRRFVIVEALYSMDGDSPDLPALRTLCDRRGACLVVDEAHSLGVLGPRGSGLCAELRTSPDVLVGTLGKAVGAAGAFVAGPGLLRDWLWNRARSFVYSTAVSPILSALALHNLGLVLSAEAARDHLLTSAAALARSLKSAGLAVPDSASRHILPLVLGPAEAAVSAARHLAEHNVRVRAIRPPTVPNGTARLRFSLKATLSAPELDRVREACQSLAGAPR